jgi:hypothetical protein
MMDNGDAKNGITNTTSDRQIQTVTYEALEAAVATNFAQI